MSLTAALAASFIAQAAPIAATAADAQPVAGYEAAAMVEGDALETGDPARLINLGVAHARRGEAKQARAMFAAAAAAGDALYLETTDGKWVEARRLANRALAMLERGAFAGAARVATR